MCNRHNGACEASRLGGASLSIRTHTYLSVASYSAMASMDIESNGDEACVDAEEEQEEWTSGRRKRMKTVPLWENKVWGSSRSLVRKIGSHLPLKPCPRACFEALPSGSDLYFRDAPLVPTLADIKWIAADDDETYARVRSDNRPLKHKWRPSPLLVMHRNSSVPNLKLKEEKMFSLKKPGTSLNRSTDLQDELSLLRSQIARLVSGNPANSGSTESLPGNMETSTPIADFAPTFQSATSFVISDITEEDELDVSEYSTSSIMESSFTHPRPMEANMSDDEDSVCLSKSNSFADMMGILKDIHKMKTSRDWSNRNQFPHKEEDPINLISEVLKQKFAHDDRQNI